MSQPITVFVVDDHPLFATGTVQALDRMPGIRGLGYATDIESAVDRIRDLQPSVVVCDVMLGDRPNGLELIARLRAADVTAPPVIYLSQFANSVLYQQAIELGAAGYLSKTVESDALRGAVLAVAGGSTVFPRAAIRPDESAEPRLPSPRELEILSMLADGRSNSEIAGRLGIAETTVESHVSRLLARYEVTTRTQLAVFADRHGWLPRGDIEYR